METRRKDSWRAKICFRVAGPHGEEGICSEVDQGDGRCCWMEEGRRGDGSGVGEDGGYNRRGVGTRMDAAAAEQRAHFRVGRWKAVDR